MSTSCFSIFCVTCFIYYWSSWTPQHEGRSIQSNYIEVATKVYIWDHPQGMSAHFRKFLTPSHLIHLYTFDWPLPLSSCPCGHKLWIWNEIFRQISDPKYPSPPPLGHFKTLGTQMGYPIGLCIWVVVKINDHNSFRFTLLSRRCQLGLPN